ncbi:MAG: NADH-quinone oxidoreductase subunit C [Desulfobacteraceae bacterium]|nr:MAG: NADH-quinone oxidoreductase subunit C [Desulfobacteraceae bacterium]
MITAVKEALLLDKVQKRFKDAILATGLFQDEVCHLVDKKALVGICEFLKNDPELNLNYLVDVLGVDYTPASPRFEVVYHLYSISQRHRLRLKVKADSEEPIPTVTGIWPAAEWPEREVYDMYGIVFEEHPDLKRIYMAPDWQGFPMRKDYPLKGYKDEYNPFGEEVEEDF